MTASPPAKLFVLVLIASGLTFGASHLQPAAAADHVAAGPAKLSLDRSGRKRVGTASFYAKKFAGKKMADGTPMHPQSDNAASKTLPLGTRARVTDLETGRSAVVTIRDRGPFVDGRIVDLSPSTAQRIGIDRKQGLAKVEVVPIQVPLADGTIKPGEAAANAAKSNRVSGGWDN
ncbi:MAG TPA: septal ring lytic transglycosylase RlpA family protein [Steroidobacteraceae bacterium]|nr:septal ring lytic transglycosylase RlpA family protein [Steroidobacteraceae bacterium]